MAPLAFSINFGMCLLVVSGSMVSEQGYAQVKTMNNLSSLILSQELTPNLVTVLPRCTQDH